MLFSSWKDKAFDPSEYDHYVWLLDEDAKETDKKGNKTKVEREKVERKKEEEGKKLPCLQVILEPFDLQVDWFLSFLGSCCLYMSQFLAHSLQIC